MKITIKVLIIVVLLFSVGCGSNAQSPEEEVQAPKKAEKKEFVVSPQEIVKGQEAKLTWNVIGTGIEKVELIASPAKEVPLKGEKIVSPEETKEYILRITNKDGTVETKHVILRVVEDGELSPAPSHQEEVIEPVNVEIEEVKDMSLSCLPHNRNLSWILMVNMEYSSNERLVKGLMGVDVSTVSSVGVKKIELYADENVVGGITVLDRCGEGLFSQVASTIDADFSNHADGFYNLSAKVWDIDGNFAESDIIRVEVNATKVREKGLQILRDQPNLVKFKWPSFPIEIDVLNKESRLFFMKTKYAAGRWKRYVKIPFKVKRGGDENVKVGHNKDFLTMDQQSFDKDKVIVYTQEDGNDGVFNKLYGQLQGGQITARDDQVPADLITHEIGHALGFDHSDPYSLMSYTPGHSPTVITAELVEALHILYFEMKAGDEVPAQ